MFEGIKKFIRKNRIQWRKIHIYTCEGCEKKRFTFKYGRAEGGFCTKCRRKELINENQGLLFKE